MNSQRPLWRRTPPAIFPICLGLLGLGLGWRNAADVIPVAHEIGDMLLGLASAFFVYFLVSFLAKIVARPAVLFEDMTNPVARGGVAALAMAMMLLAAALIPLGVSAPQVWWVGVVMQIGASAIVCHAICVETPEKRSFSPFQYLTFVGPVVGPIAGIQLGYVRESLVLTLAALTAYLVITAGLGRRLLRVMPPVPLRPSLAIFLAPNCLFALSFGMLGIDWAFTLFYWIATVVAVVLLLSVRWLTRGGWTPVWASFTFPSAAFVNLQVMAVGKGAGIAAEVLIYAGLAVATPLILYISYRSFMAWVTGDLAERSGAARA